MIPHPVRRRLVIGTALAAPFIRTARAEPVKLRVSVDTTPSHGRTIAIADFLKKLEAASQGQIKTQLFDSGQLFADRDVIKALVLGQVEMAAPGTWLVSAYVPEADLAQLPVFYGQPVEATHRAIDGIPGDLVNQQVTKKLRVAIPGRWIDLGFTNWYSTHKPLNTLEDLKGLTIRNSGGFAQPWRAKFFGGVPNMTAWPDVPLALSQGTFDALQSTNESCASAKLWDAGLRFGLIDHQNMGDYIPMISATFWGGLSPEMRTLITDLWSANIGGYRTSLLAAQDKAEKALKDHGVKIVDVPKEQLAIERQRMMEQQDAVAREMKMSPDFVARINEAVAATN
ncbi:MAG TPA: TRAP transporter substrate-binding protein DctP [Rhodopila sp.]|uniref:TRAP transporter substrate-binding protein DctP n=1 Tax=Rhodopila sp. TaxID=2480087 RepID=UPI002B7CEF69|nr:TRAP transporter substrate-binding protein DctP [Rhodopila sp.]HVY17901.1 TRAP transporter substrate-binding protein DctP [Rhodopila sp.]